MRIWQRGLRSGIWRTWRAEAGVQTSLRRRSGRLAAEILAEVREAEAFPIVVALVNRPGSATPYIGSPTLRGLEFTGVPVMVVPLRETL